jgi:hypothetical protein
MRPQGGAGGAGGGAAAPAADAARAREPASFADSGGYADAATPAPAHATLARTLAPPSVATAPRAPPEEVKPRVLTNKEDVAALLARKRGLTAAAGLATPGAAHPDDAPTPAPALKRPGLVGVTPRSGLATDKRPVIKRPAMRTPATGGSLPGDAAKRSRLGDDVSRLWDKVLKPGDAAGAGGAGGQLAPQAAADLHLRRVFVSDLPPNVDQMELRNVRARCIGLHAA